jgi:WD40 repeat protein
MRTTYLLLLATSLIVSAGSRFASVARGAADGDAAEIERLIQELGNDEFMVRDKATRRLAEIGKPALEALQKAARSHADPEVRNRAAKLLRAHEKELSGELLVLGNPTGYWVNRVAFTPDGRQAVATGGAVMLFDLQSGVELHRCLELSFARLGLVLTPDGKYFFTGHQGDKVVRMGEVKTGKELRTFTGHTDGVNALALSPDGRQLLTGSLDKTLRLWDVETAKELKHLAGAEKFRSVAFSPDGRQIATGPAEEAGQASVRLLDTSSLMEKRTFKGHTREVTAVLFSSDGRTLTSVSMDGAAVVWDVATGKELRRMLHTGGAYGGALSPDGKRLLTAGFGDKKVRLWDIGSGRELKVFEGHIGAVLGVAFAPDGRRALSSDSQNTLRLWKMPE